MNFIETIENISNKTSVVQIKIWTNAIFLQIIMIQGEPIKGLTQHYYVYLGKMYNICYDCFALCCVSAAIDSASIIHLHSNARQRTDGNDKIITDTLLGYGGGIHVPEAHK